MSRAQLQRAVAAKKAWPDAATAVAGRTPPLPPGAGRR